MFTLNNVFLCLHRLGVKFFQISGFMSQLQWDRNRFTAVGKGVKAGSSGHLLRLEFPWADGKTASHPVGAAPACEGLVAASPQLCALPFAFPALEGKVSFLC